MDPGITGRRVIAGASSKGLGRACAEALAREGVEVVMIGLVLDGGRFPGTL